MLALEGVADWVAVADWAAADWEGAADCKKATLSSMMHRETTITQLNSLVVLDIQLPAR